MDPTEHRVYLNLQHQGYCDIQYEPDGNIPPDFLVNGEIAIEVRRLNKNLFDENAVRGAEEVAIPLWKHVKKLVAGFGPPEGGRSWIVQFRFHRPVESWRTLEGKIIRALLDFTHAPVKGKTSLVRGRGFEMDVMPASRAYDTMFVMGGCIDENSGGILLTEMEANLRYCIREKTRKIERVRPRYDQWWLALVDHIGYGLNDFEQEIFRHQVSINHDWDKVLIINPNVPNQWFEI